MNKDKPLTYSIDKLKNWDKNPRSIKKDAFERLKKQITKLGQYKPLLITPDGTVLGGNMRLRAYKELGMKDIWVSVVEPKTDSEMMEYSLSDNDRAGYYDEDMFANLMPDLDLDMSMYAVDLEEPTLLSELDSMGEEVQEDEAPPVAEGEPESKLGEIYQLGRHRLMCGDATDAGAVALLMNGQKADMVFTDPPYNVGYSYSEYDDNKTRDEYVNFLKESIPLVNKTIVHNGNKKIIDMIRAFGEPYHVGCWTKTNAMSPSSISSFSVWEPIFFYGKFKRKEGSDLFNYPISNQKDTGGHTCPKPLKMCVDMINSFNEQEDIYDPFGGSGSTLIACEQTNRTCYMMELDPKYCDVIRKRYAKFIGKEDEWLEVTPKI